MWIIAALTAALGALLVLPPVAARAADGPPSAADSVFVGKVSLAVSFAVAASKLAQSSGESVIRTIAKKVAEQDGQLERIVSSAVQRLTGHLPAAPSADPAAAVQGLKTAGGKAFDTAYVDRLRATDGGLLQLAAVTRTNTGNAIVRDLAQRTGTIMMTQLPLLESSGLVELTAAPTAQPSATPKPAGPNPDAGMLAQADTGTGYLWPSVRVALVVLVAALVGAVMMARRLLARGGRPRSHDSGRHR